MKGTSAFWDSSALAPLFVREDASHAARSRWRSHPPVVWWGSSVEICGVIYRLGRGGSLTDDDKRIAVARLESMRRNWKEILPSDELRDLAVELLDTYPLRAADSLQLAASLIWCDRHPDGRVFICADQRLSNAANSAGFSVLEFPRPKT